MNTKILEILKELRPEFDFEDSNDFIEDGYLDSFDLTALIGDLEQIFDCMIDPLDIRAENFVSIDSIEELVKTSEHNTKGMNQD